MVIDQTALVLIIVQEDFVEKLVVEDKLGLLLAVAAQLWNNLILQYFVSFL